MHEFHRSSQQSPVIVGRNGEQEILRDLLSAAFDGRGGLALIGGDAGIGKTTLARRLCDEAGELDLLVLIGQADNLAETPPYGPWMKLLLGAPETNSGDAPPSFANVEDQHTNINAVFAPVLAYLEALASQRPVVLLLEDFHWADPASVDLLRFVSRDLQRVPLLALVTYREDELTRHHPLSLQIPTLVRQADALRLDLRRLQASDIRDLLSMRYALADPDEDRLVASLEQRSEGNPLFIEEILRTFEQDGVLTPADNGWTLGDLSQTRAPMLLRQIIDERVLRLGDDVYDLLATASVIGPEIDISVWGLVSDTPEDEIIDVVETAVEARLLDADAGGTSVRFAHAMIRDSLYEGILPPRRRLRHRRVATTLLATPNPDPDAVAYHLLRASDPRAAEWLVRAGERAQRSYALLTAADRFDAALALLESKGAAAGERAELMYRIARMRRYADPRESLHYLDEAIVLAGSAADDMLIAYMRCFRGGLLCAIGDMRRGLAEMKAGLGRIGALESDERKRLRSLQERLGEPRDEYQYRGAFANWLAVTGRANEAIAEGERVVELEPAHGVGTSGYANALRALASAYALMGAPDNARRACARASSEYRSVEHPYQFGNSRLLELFEVVLPYQADDLEERRRLADEAERAWESASGATVDLPPRFVWLPLLLIEGDWSEARDLAEAARTPTRRRGWRPFATTMLAVLSANQGDSENAWRLIREQLPAGPDTEPGDGIFLDVTPLQRLAASLALDQADPEAARFWLESHDRWLDWSGAVLGRADGHLAWAGYLRGVGRRTEATQRARRAIENATAPRQPLTLLAAQRLLGELEISASRFNESQEWLECALALSDACRALYERALTLIALAELELARKSSFPRDLLDEATAILRELGAGPALVRIESLASQAAGSPGAPPPAGLTARELEVLRLVAEGRTDREIADALFISPRTVTTHITRILTKLDVGSRTAAAAFALREGIV